MKIVGVTACPTGIAHTYMSAEKLEVTARNLNHQAKFETQGVKTENQLSEQEIKEADAIILAVDKEIELDRFAGKKSKACLYKPSNQRTASSDRRSIEKYWRIRCV